MGGLIKQRPWKQVQVAGQVLELRPGSGDGSRQCTRWPESLARVQNLTSTPLPSLLFLKNEPSQRPSVSPRQGQGGTLTSPAERSPEQAGKDEHTSSERDLNTHRSLNSVGVHERCHCCKNSLGDHGEEG